MGREHFLDVSSLTPEKIESMFENGRAFAIKKLNEENGDPISDNDNIAVALRNHLKRLS
jgi:hypothetical protein